MQQRTWEILGLALAIGIAIAAFATVYAGKFERDLRRERAKDAQLSRDLQRLSAKLTTAQEEERGIIARELHDDVGQLLTAIKVELSLAERTIQAEGGATDNLQNARSIADGALQRVRDLSRLLHPPVLDDLGLATALDYHVKAVSRRHNLQIAFAAEHTDRRLPPQVELTAYRIVQEALTNVIKHARASQCRVSLQQLPDTLVVRIEDNGTGFDPKSQRGETAGLGLIGIRERVAQLGGILDIYSELARGTRITVLLPAENPTAASPADDASASTVSLLDMTRAVLNG